MIAIGIILGLSFGLIIMLKTKAGKLGYKPTEIASKGAFGKYTKWYYVSLVLAYLILSLLPIYGQMTESYRLSINPERVLLSALIGTTGFWFLGFSFREASGFYRQFSSQMTINHRLLILGHVGVATVSIVFVAFAIWIYWSNVRVWWFS